MSLPFEARTNTFELDVVDLGKETLLMWRIGKPDSLRRVAVLSGLLSLRE
jgi:hypothetical protein